MKNLCAVLILSTLILSTTALFAPVCVHAQASGAPASAESAFSGYFVRVGDLWFDPVDDGKAGKPIQRLEVNEPDADNIWAGDAGNSILRPWAREIVASNAKAEIRRQHVYTADDSCWPSGVPQIVNRLDEVEFLPLKDRVVILYRRDHQVRHVYLDVAHSERVKPSWYGESIGHYEGGTLVVDTIGLKAHRMSVVDPFGTPHTADLHVIERYRPFATPFGKGIEVTVKVEDAGAFTMSWEGVAEYRENKAVQSLDEMVCAENDRSFADGSTFGTLPEETTPSF